MRPHGTDRFDWPTGGFLISLLISIRVSTRLTSPPPLVRLYCTKLVFLIVFYYHLIPQAVASMAGGFLITWREEKEEEEGKDVVLMKEEKRE